VFPAMAQHGGFTVLIRLTESGREKLLGALEGDANEAGIYPVGWRLDRKR
jgi:hypothetical protein